MKSPAEMSVSELLEADRNVGTALSTMICGVGTWFERELLSSRRAIRAELNKRHEAASVGGGK